MNLLSIGGSDPSSGAGIQSDVKSFALLDAYGLTTITAITGQNTSKFGKIEPVSKKILKNQLDSLFSDFTIDGIKIGMVYNSEIIRTISEYLKKLNVPVVVDPVIRSTTGGMLIKKTAISDFKKYLISNSTVLTPNKFEAEFLTKSKIKTAKDLPDLGEKLLALGTKNVIITGLEFDKNHIMDFIMNEKEQHWIKNNKIKSTNHGSGGIHSAALTFSMACGESILDSAKQAQEFTLEAIKSAKILGKGIEITSNKTDKNHLELSNAIKKFSSILQIHEAIPECQTNFVFAKKSPKSLTDVLGISGRLVKSGNSVIKAGPLRYGGSKHVATALLTMNKKFPHIRSAINLKYESKTITKLEKKGFIVKNYDRTKEPNSIKSKEGSSIKWGITKIIKKSNNPPDAVFHKGDFGKEPMIIIFGSNPTEIIEKISKIFPQA